MSNWQCNGELKQQAQGHSVDCVQMLHKAITQSVFLFSPILNLYYVRKFLPSATDINCAGNIKTDMFLAHASISESREQEIRPFAFSMEVIYQLKSIMSSGMFSFSHSLV